MIKTQLISSASIWKGFLPRRKSGQLEGPKKEVIMTIMKNKNKMMNICKDEYCVDSLEETIVYL